MSNFDEEFQREPHERDKNDNPTEPYSYYYLILDIFLLYPCWRKRNKRIDKYIQEKNKVNARLDVVDLIIAIQTLKTSVNILNNERMAHMNSDKNPLTDEERKEKPTKIVKRKNNYLRNPYSGKN